MPIYRASLQQDRDIARRVLSGETGTAVACDYNVQTDKIDRIVHNTCYHLNPLIYKNGRRRRQADGAIQMQPPLLAYLREQRQFFFKVE